MAAEIPDGAVIVARAIVNSSLWTMRSDDRVMAILCIVRANWRDRDWFDGEKTLTIKRGQFVTTRRDLAKDSRLSEQKARTSIKHLEKCGFLTQKPTQTYTVITIPKYDFYQDLSKYSDRTNPETNPQLTHAQPTPNPRPTQVQPSPNPKQEGNKGEEGKEGEEGRLVALAKSPTVACPSKVETVREHVRALCLDKDVGPAKFEEYLRTKGVGKDVNDWRNYFRGTNGTQHKPGSSNFVPKNWTGEGQRQAAEIKRPSGENITR